MYNRKRKIKSDDSKNTSGHIMVPLGEVIRLIAFFFGTRMLATQKKSTLAPGR